MRFSMNGVVSILAAGDRFEKLGQNDQQETIMAKPTVLRVIFRTGAPLFAGLLRADVIGLLAGAVGLGDQQAGIVGIEDRCPWADGLPLGPVSESPSSPRILSAKASRWATISGCLSITFSVSPGSRLRQLLHAVAMPALAYFRPSDPPETKKLI
jgi:hypothetical protein